MKKCRQLETNFPQVIKLPNGKKSINILQFDLTFIKKRMS